ncbi:hypothetical protein D3C84_1276440 [compost metagenome]
MREINISATDRGKVRSHAGIAVVQTVGRGLAGEGMADPLLQLILLGIGVQQIP